MLDTTKFRCPTCEAKYKVVRIEAPPTAAHGCAIEKADSHLSTFALIERAAKFVGENLPKRGAFNCFLCTSAANATRTPLPGQTRLAPLYSLFLPDGANYGPGIGDAPGPF